MSGALKHVRVLDAVAESAPQVRLVATIKRTSRYYSQADFEPGSLSVQLAFAISMREDLGGYVFVGGPGGAYRAEDLHLFAVAGPHMLVALS